MANTFQATVCGKEYALPPGSTLRQIAAMTDGGETPVAALVDGEIAEMSATVSKDCAIEFLYPRQNEEASRIYLRGLSFLLLRAVRESFKDAHLYMEYVLIGGIYCTIDYITPMTPHQVRILEEKMKAYVREGLPFTYRRTSTDRAIAYFDAEGQPDKVHLLRFRPFDYFNMYEYDGIRNYFYGIMPDSAACLGGFSLKHFDKGFVLYYPAPYRTEERAEEQPKLARVFSDAERWAQILEVSKVAELNDLVKNKGLREFIRVNEALHEKKLAELANNICERPKARVVLIAGPSSSGKTTFANRLRVHLRVHGRKSHAISIDDYYLPRERIPEDENGNRNLESVAAIDTERFNADILQLLNSGAAVLPGFDFLTGRRGSQRELRVGEEDLLIIEGIHGLNDRLTEDIDEEFKYKIFISPLCPLNLDNQNTVFPEDIRLLRRLVRDKLTRGYGFLDTLNIWESVRAGEYKYILPYMENADTLFNSSLLYEAAILKKYAYEELTAIKTQCIRANYLVKFLNYFLSCDDDDEVPKTSILREFIGDSCFY